jgi:hypothetical protein
MATVTGLTAARINELVNGRVAAVSKTVTTVAPAVVSGEGAFGTLQLGKAFRLDKLEVNRKCRLRLYASAAQRTADSDRPRDQDPVGNHGLIAEMIMTAEILSLLLLPAPHGYVESGFTYFSVVNDDATGDITITFTEQVLEI